MVFREAKITDTHSSRKRAIVDLSELALCEPCAPSNSADAGGTALDNANPIQKGSRFCVICGKYSSYGPIGGAKNSAFLCSEDGKKHGGCESIRRYRCHTVMWPLVFRRPFHLVIRKKVAWICGHMYRQGNEEVNIFSLHNKGCLNR